jgi:hypothetical protein
VNRIDTLRHYADALQAGLDPRIRRNDARAANHWLLTKHKYTLSRFADVFSDCFHSPSPVRLKNLRSGSSGADGVAEGERTYIHKHTLKEPCVPYAYQPPLRSLRPPHRLDSFIRCQDRM